MREIKFKILWKEFVQPVWKIFNIEELKEECLLGEDKYNWSTMRQYTEMQDYRGAEIYEGDVIKGNFRSEDGEHEIISNVIYSKYLLAYVVEYKNGRGDEFEILLSDYWDTLPVIVGNIYENKELLK
jgi:hypothetical protein